MVHPTNTTVAWPSLNFGPINLWNCPAPTRRHPPMPQRYTRGNEDRQLKQVHPAVQAMLSAR
jgi:hypothetical protein